MHRAGAVVALVACAAALAGCGPQVVVPQAAVGECIQATDLDSDVAQFTVVSCGQSHDAEVFAVVQLDYAGEFDLDAIVEESNAACLERFEPYVGVDYNDSSLLIRPVHPTELTWEAGDTETICVATSPEMVTESFAGSGI